MMACIICDQLIKAHNFDKQICPLCLQVNRPLHMAKTEIHSRRRKPKSPLVTLPDGGGGGGDFIGGSQHGDFSYMSSANPIDLSHLSEVETSSAEGGGGGGGSGDQQEADLMATGEVVQDVGL